MHWIEILLFFVPLLFAEGTNLSQFPTWQSSWIRGGSTTVVSSAPSMASLRTVVLNRHFCGGSLISHWFVMTAAHCIEGRQPASMLVVVGTTKLDGHRGVSHGVVSYVIHPDYNPSTLKNDIGLIKLRTPVTFTNSMHSIQLPVQDLETAAGARCQFLGWGKDSPSSPDYSSDLHLLKFRILSTLQCLQSYLHLSVTYICADAGPDKGASQGDEGGPLICRGKQIGVYSGEKAPGPGFSPPHATLFIKVSKYINWIQENTRM